MLMNFAVCFRITDVCVIVKNKFIFVYDLTVNFYKVNNYRKMVLCFSTAYHAALLNKPTLMNLKAKASVAWLK